MSLKPEGIPVPAKMVLRNDDSSATSSSSSMFSEPPSSSSSDSIQAEQHNRNVEASPSEDAIAIIGFSIKFPGEAESAESFWNIMMEGGCTASEFPPERMNHQAYHSQNTAAEGTIRPMRAHLLKEDLALFDASFFGLTAAEANAMDPQQRFLLETTYRALENSGIPMEQIDDTNTSVHAGCFTADYMVLTVKDPDRMPKYTATGMTNSMLSNRISSFFNLKGPSVTVDTACSSSLVALSQACDCLKNGDSSMGVVAGCNLVLALDNNIALSTMGFLSPDGICHSFDHRANGYARAEGFGVVIIKRLSDAVRDGNNIRAVIRAAKVNQDGRTPLAQPSKHAQAQLINDTYESVGLDFSKTRYVEAHGTGTAIGDPLEAQAIGLCFGAARANNDGGVYVGSLKANFGHLEGAAGIAGLIKSILILERGLIPPLAGLEKVNPEIDAEFLKIIFPTKPTPWPQPGLRRVSVNSFGFGGTNAHVVLDDAHYYMMEHGVQGNHCTVVTPSDAWEYAKSRIENEEYRPQSTTFSRPSLFLWSAYDDTSLKGMTRKFEQWFTKVLPHSDASKLVDRVSGVLAHQRSQFAWRSFLVVQSIKELQQWNVSVPIRAHSSADLALAFVFTGQGAQWCGMGKQMLQYEVFRQSVQAGISFLKDLGCELDLESALTGDIASPQRLDRPGFAQPICTILQVALVDFLASLNINPSVVIGHSSGEIAAAYAAGAISHRSAWKLAYYRGLFSDQVANSANTHGAMISVGLSEQETEQRLALLSAELGKPADLVVACVNSPTNVTVSGDKDYIKLLQTELEKESIFSRLLRVPVAYHSPHMQVVSNEYLKAIGSIESGYTHFARPVNMVSSVTGERISNEKLLESAYWVRNLVSPVRFLQAIHSTFRYGRPAISKKLDLSHQKLIWATDILEIGPHATLSGPIRDCLKSLSSAHVKDVTYRSLLIRLKDGSRTMLNAVAELHCRGYSVCLSKLLRPTPGSFTPDLAHLPEYPFNHKNSYWAEPRISKELRFRDLPRNPYIGTPVADWNPKDARWRHFLSPGSSSWIADHTINSRTVFPAAGMLTMATEAILQLSKCEEISAVEILNATFHSALDLSSYPEGTETQLQLMHQNPTSNKAAVKYDFILRAYQFEWSEICRGTIRTIPASARTADNGFRSKESHLEERAIDHYNRVSSLCTEGEVDKDQLYSRMWKFGYHFGDHFRRILSSRYSKTGEATAEVGVLRPDTSEMPTIIHPATLDGILQIMVPGITKGGEDSSWSLSLPTRISRIWISTNGLRYTTSDKVAVAIKIQQNGARMTKSDIVAFSADKMMRVFVEGIETTSISGSLESVSASSISRKRLCWNIEHKPDVDRMQPSQLREYLVKDAAKRSLSSQYQEHLNQMLLMFMVKTENELAEGPPICHEDHLQYYRQWMARALGKSHVDRAKLAHLAKDMVLKVSPEWSDPREASFSRIYWRIGNGLIDILRQRIDPLEFLFQGSDIAEYYENIIETADFKMPLERYLDLITHKNPTMRILEIGAGTGSTSRHVLQILAPQGSQGRNARYSSYHYTDISPSFFEKAMSEFREFPRMKYTRLDIACDPVSQGYEAESFDLVVASFVLHATKSVSQSLAHVWKLLKPGGKLVLLEVANPESLGTGFVFGLLPGWWLSQETCRRDRLSPAYTEEEWHGILSSCGFTGVDQTFYSQEDHTTALLLSTKSPEKIAPITVKSPSLIIPLTERVHTHGKPLVQACADRLRNIGIHSSEVSFDSIASTEDLTETLLILIDSPSAPFLRTLTPDLFEAFRRTVSRATNVLWISPLSKDAQSGQPDGDMYGVARTLMSENASLNFTVYRPSHVPSYQATDFGDNLRKVIAQCLPGASPHRYEPEIIEHDEVLHIPRIIEYRDMNESIYEQAMPHVRREMRFGDENLRLTVQSPGLLDSLSFVQYDYPSSDFAPNEVEVRVMAVGVNFKDCLVALGRIPGDTLGCECSGVIERVGTASEFRPGDRVMVAFLDAFRPFVRCPDRLVARIPDRLSFQEAAKVPIIFLTAYYSLVEVGRLEKGETVLIHAGAGGTGQAAIQIAKLLGASVVVTVGSKEKRDLAASRYAIPEDHIFYSRDTSFAEGVKHLTRGKGVDMILNSLSGDALKASWDCIAPYGRFVEIGKRDALSHEMLPMSPFTSNVSFTAVDIAALIQQRPEKLHKILRTISGLLAEGEIAIPAPLKTFPIHQIEEAFRYLQSGTNSGCVAVEIHQDARVEALVRPSKAVCFKGNVTYVLSGGLGGQGRSIARWMVQKGARHLLLLSRRGRWSDESACFIAEMHAIGVQIETPTCDVADAESLRTALDQAIRSMPPIKGCIQGAMVLKDALFTSMTYDEWVSAFRPKVPGSWNLHEQLPNDLDFFILLSSAGGVFGSGGQANYSSGNTYQDSLAAYRLSQGQRAVSLNLSAMSDDGYLAERKEMLQMYAEVKYVTPMSQAELFPVLEHYCDPDIPITKLKSQVVMGLTPPADAQEGLDIPFWMERPMFSHLRHLEPVSGRVTDSMATTQNGQHDLSTLKSVESPVEACKIISAAIQNKIATVLCRELADIQTDKPLHTHGIDSLVAVELRNWFLKTLQADISVFEILGGASVESLGAFLTEKLGIGLA